jgi:predicted DNA-binding transcriptional regulator YafY
MSKNNIDRPLRLALRLLKGEKIQQQDWMAENEITDRSAQRDAKEIRQALKETDFPAELNVSFSDSPLYSLINGGAFDEQTVFTLAKLLRGTRVFPKDQLQSIVNGLMAKLDPLAQAKVKNYLAKNLDDYRSTTHGHDMLALSWEMAEFIATKQAINFRTRDGNTHVGVPTRLWFAEDFFWVQIQNLTEKSVTVHRLDELGTLFPNFSADTTDFRPLKGHQPEPARLSVIGDTQHLVEQFPGAIVEKHDDNTASVFIKNYDPAALQKFALTNLTSITILAPESLRTAIINALDSAKQHYLDN